MDLTHLTTPQIADLLLDPTRIIPTIVILIEWLDEQLDGIGGRTKKVMALAFSATAPIAGVGLRVWLGTQAIDASIAGVGLAALMNVLGSTKLHDALDNIAAKKAVQATAAAIPQPAIPTNTQVLLPVVAGPATGNGNGSNSGNSGINQPTIGGV